MTEVRSFLSASSYWASDGEASKPPTRGRPVHTASSPHSASAVAASHGSAFNVTDTSNAELAEGRVRYRKGAGPETGMTYIDYGLSVVSARVVSERIPRDAVSDLAELFTDLGERGMLAGFEVYERFYEVGSESGIADLEDMLARRTGAQRP